jgi:hypothetical protein
VPDLITEIHAPANAKPVWINAQDVAAVLRLWLVTGEAKTVHLIICNDCSR